MAKEGRNLSLQNKVAASAPARPGGGNFGGGKGKGKGKKGKTPPMPQALRNKWRRTGNGDPLCFYRVLYFGLSPVV